MADLARIKANVSKMASMNAPEEDIDGYISQEGVTIDDVRNFNPISQEQAKFNRHKPIIDEVMGRVAFAAHNPLMPSPVARFMGDNAKGVFNTATLEIPRFLAKKATGVDIGAGGQAGRLAGYAIPGAAAERGIIKLAPKLAGAALKKQVPRFAATGLATGLASAPSENIDEFGDLGKRAGQGALGAVIGAATPLAVHGAMGTFKALKNTPKFIRNIGRRIEKMKNPPTPTEERILGIKKQASNQSDAAKEIASLNYMNSERRLLRMSENEISQTKANHGGSTAGLVDEAKSILNKKVTSADSLFEQTVRQAPKTIRVKTDKFAKALKNKIAELKSGIGKPNPVVRDLEFMLDDITQLGEQAKVSNILGADGKPIQIQPQTQKAGYKELDKNQFLGTRRNLNDLLTNNGEIDRHIMDLKNILDDSGVDSGVNGLKEAKSVYKAAQEKAERFLNRNTGDLKIANESTLNKIGTKSGLNKQTLDHIKELEDYIGNPLIDRASKINKIREFETTFNPEKPLPVPFKEKLRIDEKLLLRNEKISSRKSTRDNLARKKAGRANLAKIGGGAAALFGLPEVGRRAFRLLSGNAD